MTLEQIRRIRRILFALFVGASGFVTYHLVRGTGSRQRETIAVEEPRNRISRGVEIEQLDSEGRRAWVLKASESTGRTETAQTFRDVEIRFDAGPDDVPVVVTAEHCEVDQDRAVKLTGNVVVRDDEGLRLESSTLHFRRYPNTVWSHDPVRYEKPGLVGTSGAMRYVLPHGQLDLMDGVDMTFRKEGDAPVNVKSRSALMRRKRNYVRFVDDVRVRQRTKTLRCNDLQLYLTEDESEIEHMVAYHDVDLHWDVPPEPEPENESENEGESETVSATDTETSAIAGSPGRKRLVTNRLELVFREGGETLERVRAVDGGRLYLFEPEGAIDGYDKELSGHLLAFDFDEAGRLLTLRGRGGVELVLAPVAEDGGSPRVVTARQLEVDFEPESGELVEARCYRSVEFQHDAARASADTGVFFADGARLVLTDSPRLWDERVSLEAEEIRIDTVSGDVEAEGRVRSASRGEEGKRGETSHGDGGLFPGSGGGPVYFVADRLDYDREADVALYTGGARGFRGPNRVEADEIRIEQRRGTLVARHDVRTVFVREGNGRDRARDTARQHGEGEGEEAAGHTTVTRAAEMHYRREARRLEYGGGAEIRYDDVTMRAERIDVVLATASDEIEQVFARGGVDVATAEGKAKGETARYLPAEESFTVAGPSAAFESAGKLTEGKQLTFFLTDDRIFVDGREESRTKTTYTSKPRPF